MPGKLPGVRGNFRCKTCGASFPVWRSVCQTCGAWESYVKLPEPRKDVPIAKITPSTKSQVERISTGISSVDTVLGGGLVPGSVLLIGGEPGMGKSTLLLWIGELLARSGQGVLYIAGEESAEQISERGKRIGAIHEKLSVLVETDTQRIAGAIYKAKPRLVIVDSLQTCHHPDWDYPPDSPTQLKVSAAALCATAKKYKAALWLVGHVDKQGNLRGPQTVMHLVDTVLYLEGDPNSKERCLLGVKNRFGATDPVAILEMRADGLKEPEPKEPPQKGRKSKVNGI